MRAKLRQVRDRRRQFLAGVVAVLVACMVTTCRPQESVLRQRSSLITDLSELLVQAKNSRWWYHPPVAAKMRMRLATKSGGSLFVGERGERWWFPGESAPSLEVAVGAGTGQVKLLGSAQVASETLISAQQIVDGGWLFVGQSGTVYEARQPLGKFFRASAPPEKLARVSAAGTAVVGITKLGRLMVTRDAGLSWADVTHSERAADVAIGADGVGLALFMPERLWWTSDYAKTWQPFVTAPFGALRVRNIGGQVAVSGIRQSRTFVATPEPSWLTDSPQESVLELPQAVAKGPSAAAVVGGRATYFRSRRGSGAYVEVRLQKGSASPELLFGEHGQALRVQPLKLEKKCARLFVQAREKVFYVACAEQAKGSSLLHVYSSVNGGRSWQSEGSPFRAKLSEFRWLALPGKRVILSGICPPTANARGCLASGVYLHKTGGGAAKTLPIADFDGVALGLAMSPSGQRVVVVGRRTKTDSLQVFVANSKVAKFTAHSVPVLEMVSEGRTARGGIAVRHVSVDEAGYISAVVREAEAKRALVLTLDPAGQLVGLRNTPSRSSAVSTFGLRALVHIKESGEVLESIDGGSHWLSRGRAQALLCGADKSVQCPVHCHALGCVLGDTLSRVGWRAPADEQALSDGGFSFESSTPEARVSVATPISCQLSDEHDWETTKLSRYPGAGSSAMGSVQWFGAIANAHAPGGISVLEARQAELHTRDLFSQKKAGGEVAGHVSLQIEGLAALRQTQAGALEVAWHNYFKPESSGQATLLTTEQFGRGKNGRFATPPSVSIAGEGIFVSLGPLNDSKTYFATRSRVEEVAALPPRKRRQEWVRLDGHSVLLKIKAPALGAERGVLKGGVWSWQAMSVGLLMPEQFGLRQVQDLAYVGGRVGLHIAWFGPGAPASRIYPFEPTGNVFGAPYQVPSLRNLGVTPTACSDYVRASTPRVVVPSEGKNVHPVLIHDVAESLPVMVSTGAVLHGSPKEPCVATFEAQPLAKDAQSSALVDMRPTTASWFFRAAVTPAGKPSGAIEARPMSCQFDPTAPLPPKLQRLSER